jgi:phosphoribosylanthranilate isomerase
VGVFADETSASHVVAAAQFAGVGALQLHGPRFPEITRALAGYFLIRAVAVRDRTSFDGLGRWANAYVLDGYHPTLLGGTGKTFDWKSARAVKRLGPIILAGGLTAENVGQAIREARPYAVDVAGGVESALGIKGPEKLRAFFAAVAEADRRIRVGK